MRRDDQQHILLGLDVLSLAAAALFGLTKSNVSQFPEFLGECLLLVFWAEVGRIALAPATLRSANAEQSIQLGLRLRANNAHSEKALLEGGGRID